MLLRIYSFINFARHFHLILSHYFYCQFFLFIFSLCTFFHYFPSLLSYYNFSFYFLIIFSLIPFQTFSFLCLSIFLLYFFSLPTLSPYLKTNQDLFFQVQATKFEGAQLKSSIYIAKVGIILYSETSIGAPTSLLKQIEEG